MAEPNLAQRLGYGAAAKLVIINADDLGSCHSANVGVFECLATGTVTTDVANAVKEVKAGKVEFRVDKTGVIHVPCGKVSFETGKLLANVDSLIQAVIKAKPAAAKGKYVKSVTICSTMGPGVHLDVTTYNAKQL